MSISVDTINLRFNVKPDYDQQQLQQLQDDLKQGQNELEKTRKAMDKLAKNGLNAMTKEERKEFDRLSESLTKTAREVHENEQKMKEFTRTANINKMSLQQLGQRAKDLTAVLNNLNPETDDFKEYKMELDAVKERMKELRSVADNTKSSLRSFTEGFNQIGFAITNALAIKNRIVQWADQYVQSFAQMDDAMTDIMKYTGQTKREVEEMNETFSRMTTRTPREELNALAGAAGRLGITARRDIEGFVDAADKINVALGDDLGEGAIDQIGKLTMVFGEDKTKGLNGAMLATGSAINVLGASSSASTGFITEFTSAMAGMAVNARISQTDIMGYASALSQAGVEGQTASGVFAQMITKMFTDPAKFARAAKLDVKAFTDLLKTDANAAILQFLEGLKQNGGFDSLAPALKSLKMQGTQAVPVISSLINKMDELKEAQRTAREAYEDGTSIIDEFNKANSSAAAKLEIAKKRLNDVSVELGQRLMPIVEGSITATTAVLRIITAIIGIIAEYRTTIITATAAVVAWNAATIATVTWTRVLSPALAAATTAVKAFGRALATNPFGAAIAAGTLLVAVIKDISRQADGATRALKDMAKAEGDATLSARDEERETERLVGIIKSQTTSENEKREALDQLNRRMTESHLPNLTEEAIRTGKATEQLKKYNQEFRSRLQLESLEGQMRDSMKRQAEAQRYIDEHATGPVTIEDGRTFDVSKGGDHTGSDAIWERNIQVVEQEKAYQDKLMEKISELRDASSISRYFQEQLEQQRIKLEGTPDSPASSTTSTDTETDKERNKRIAADRRAMKEEEQLAEQSYKRELQLLRNQYQGRKNLADEWHSQEFKAEQKYLDELAQIRLRHHATEAEREEVANKALDSISREAMRRMEAEKQEQQRQLQQIDWQQAEAEIALARQRLDGELADEKEYNRRKLESDIDYQRQRLQVLTEGSSEYQAALRRLLQLEQQQHDEQQADKATVQNDSNQWLREVEMKGESFDRMRQLNEQYYADDLISYQQYQQNLSDITQQEEDVRKRVREAAINAVNNLLSSSSQLFSAMQQREISQVEAKYKKLIAAAKKQGKDTTKLEEKLEKEKSDIQKKYAEKQFMLNVLQIIASTATGIARLWKDLPFYAALPLTAVVADSGAAQLASAKMAADEAAGLYRGGYSDDYADTTVPAASPAGVEGYTKKGDPRKQAGFIPVHQSEFVANHRAVANPEVRPVLDVIDRHQRMGDIQMLNATRLLEEAYGQGRYRGGYTADGQLPSHVGAGPGVGSDSQFQSDVVPLLERIERNTARSLTVRSLRDEIAHEEQLERNARR